MLSNGISANAQTRHGSQKYSNDNSVPSLSEVVSTLSQSRTCCQIVPQGIKSEPVLRQNACRNAILFAKDAPHEVLNTNIPVLQLARFVSGILKDAFTFL
jgi:hypothetical protein